MTTAYFDCSHGISGNAILGALIDCGLPVDALKATLRCLLDDDRYTFAYEKIELLSMKATYFDVVIPPDASQQSIRFDKMIDLVTNSKLKTDIKAKAIDVLRVLALGYAYAHHCEISEVSFDKNHFIDTMIDVVGACWGLDYFKVDHVMASPLHVGSGTINYRYGTLTIPAPATQHILTDIPHYQTMIQGELVTPTGAAIIKALTSAYCKHPIINITHIGYGAPIKTLDHPGWLRLTIGKDHHEPK